MKANLKNYLSLTKKEWNGLVVLVVLIFIALTAPNVYRYFHKDKITDFKDFDEVSNSLKSTNYTSANTTPSAATKLFNFNPNNLLEDQWKQLGLTERQISILKHYEAKGGHFYRKSDLRKIYSITDEDYKRLEPYIQLPAGNANDKPATIIEINHADSAQLTTLKGIGPAYAMRILRYRNKLGGFYRKEQLKEVFGVDEERYLAMEKQVRINPALILKLNINKATFEDLRRFPYLSYKQNNAIIQYRNEHGDYDSLNDMKDISILDEATLAKIKPYLVFAH